MNTECMKCEEIISAGEFEQNQGLCWKCYKGFDILEARGKVCPTCQGIKRTKYRFEGVPCVTCRGIGVIEDES